MHTYLILCLIVGILAAIVLVGEQTNKRSFISFNSDAHLRFVVVVENALSYNALSCKYDILWESI